MCSKSETFKWLEQMNDRSLLFNLRAGLNTRIKFMNIAMNLSMAFVESTTWTTPRVSGASLDQVQVPSKRHNIKSNYDKLCICIQKGLRCKKYQKVHRFNLFQLSGHPESSPFKSSCRSTTASTDLGPFPRVLRICVCVMYLSHRPVKCCKCDAKSLEHQAVWTSDAALVKNLKKSTRVALQSVPGKCTLRSSWVAIESLLCFNFASQTFEDHWQCNEDA